MYEEIYLSCLIEEQRLESEPVQVEDNTEGIPNAILKGA